MSLIEILKMSFLNLWQRKLRTVLNLIGIVTGCVMLLMTSAGATGVRDGIDRIFDTSVFARQIYVFNGFKSDVDEDDIPESAYKIDAEMSPERKERIEKRLKIKWRRENSVRKRITIDQQWTREMEQTKHVQEVVHDLSFPCSLKMNGEDYATYTEGIGFQDKSIEKQIVAGKPLSITDTDGILVHEFFAYKMGFESDEELNQLVGQKVQVEYQIKTEAFSMLYQIMNNIDDFEELDNPKHKSRQNDLISAFFQIARDLDKTDLSDEQKKMIRQMIKLPNKQTERITQREFRVVGVYKDADRKTLFQIFRQAFLGTGGDLILHHNSNQELFFTNPKNKHAYSAVVTVDRAKNLKQIVEKIEEAGYESQSSLDVLEDVDEQIQNITYVIYGLAIAILVIAAIGISNTLIISVLERTPEIGIMKSMGARDFDILKLMLCEGASLGMIGAAVSLMVSLVLSQAGQWILRDYVEGRIGRDLDGGLFSFSMWAIAAIFLISTVVSVLASILPSYRAARLDPIVAMKRN